MTFRGDAVQRAEAAFAARCEGLTWRQVAERVGYSEASAAQRAVTNYIGDAPDIDKDQVRAVWRERVEWLWHEAREDVIERRQGAVTHAVRTVGMALQLDGLARTKPDGTPVGGFEDFIALLTVEQPAPGGSS